MFGEDRRLRLGERPTLAIILTWLCISVILLAVASTRILDNQYPDPDDALRLAQVRDLLAGQAWYDLHQYRMTPPDGTLMHWSRLVDLPIAGMILFDSRATSWSRHRHLPVSVIAFSANFAVLVAVTILCIVFAMIFPAALAHR